jgi:hypothetical protein
MTQKKIEPVYIDEDGTLVVNVCCDEANSDWIRSARLANAARKGDKAAQAGLHRMSATPMMEEVDDEQK